LEGNYIQWLNDEDVCKYNSHHVFPYQRENAVSYIKGVVNSQTALVLAIILQKGDTHIGNVALQDINYISRSAEFTIILGEKKYWGKGYAKESSLLITRHGFLALNLHRIYCGTSSENKGMQRLAACLGMSEEGRRRDALYKDGRYVDIIEYGVLRDEFFRKNR
jgi:RimJ/RimL family protein N-acetyltransferase